jgi:hypothetical protein
MLCANAIVFLLEREHVVALTDILMAEKVVSLTEHHPIRAYCRSGSIAPRILDHGTRWR